MWTRLVFLPVAIGICFPLCCHSQKSDSPLFERLPPSFTGVDFESRIEADHPMARLYHSGFACGGVAIGDIDDDGRPDIYLVNGPGPNRLYRQVDAFRFEDATESPGLDGSDHWGTGATMADIDNDGDLDIYLCNYDAPNQLFLNRGDGTFLEAAAAFGVDVRDASLMPSFCDYDRDGDLDLFITTYRYYREGGLPEVAGHLINGEARVLRDFEKYYTVHNEVRAGRKASRIGTYGRADYLLENDGNGRFTNVTARAGLGGHGLGLAATWWDYNSDGWPDLYLSNDFADPDRLYRNNRDGTFTDVLLESVPHTPWFSMGADSADLNNDGLPDLLAADMSATTHFMEKTTMGAMNAAKLASVAGPPPQYMRNALYLNTGTGRFLEAAYLAGLADSDWSWAVKLADLDNDGRVDAFISNGMTRNFNNSDMPANSSMLIGRTQWDLYRDTPTRPERNLAFRNDGNLHFSETGKNWGLDHLGMSFGAALADLDSDGDLDLVVTNLDEPVGIYRNHSSSNWIAFQLIGNKSNSKGIGATVRLYSGSTSQYRRLQPVTGMLSSNQPIVHFGLGNATDPCSITINWPSGAIQKIEDLAANIYHRIEEKDDSPLPDETPSNEEKPSTPLYLAHSALANQHHRECLDFDDFAQQPLLPNRLSLLGPGMAWDDIDRDGDYDVFLSGAAGQPGRLLRNNGDGDFCLIETPCLVEDLHHEDMGAVFFDADSDGDSDLYVVSGGVEHPVGSPALRDRLYLNAGDGSFSRSGPHALPDIRDSGSVVAAADYDRDGDLDLFIGGRVIPGRYPLAPRSRLLRNDSGIFHDTTESSPQLSVAGMVTSATWSDTDSDGWIDLLLTLEWGPVKWFRNENGRLVDRSSQAGLENRSGWWNGIAAADLDGDSDIDYVVTNFGLNTKYHASPEKPALLYYGDFDGRGRMRLVEAEYEHQNLFPIRGRSCSTHAMPFLADKFKSYREFALADLRSIYPPQRLNSAHRFAASTLESGVLLNDGKGVLSFLPLPRLAQIAPSFGVAIFNADDDPHPDLFLAQNFFGPQPETGRMDGGLGLLLAGNGDGTFLPLWPAQSGIVSPDDGRSLATIDLNADGWLDLAIGNNNGRANCFVRRSGAESRPITVRLTGNPGNPSGVGARVTVCFQDGTIRSAEIYAGGGYLSQCPPLVTFATGGSEVDSIEIRWPDGRQSLQQGRKGAFVYEIAYATASLQQR